MSQEAGNCHPRQHPVLLQFPHNGHMAWVWLSESREQPFLSAQKGPRRASVGLQPKEFPSRAYGCGTPACGHTQANTPCNGVPLMGMSATG